LYSKAHGAKVWAVCSFLRDLHRVEQTSNLIINLDHDEWILEDDAQTLLQREFGQHSDTVLHDSLLQNVRERDRGQFLRSQQLRGFQNKPRSKAYVQSSSFQQAEIPIDMLGYIIVLVLEDAMDITSVESNEKNAGNVQMI
jgi:hypothetical protein